MIHLWNIRGTVFCKTSLRRSKCCLEFSITWGRLKMCRWQVRLFLVEKMKPKLFGFKNEMEREIRKCLTFVRRGECRRVELCSRKFILNFNQTNLESQVKSVRFLLNKPIKWVNRRVKTEAKNWSSSWRVACYQRWRRRIRTRRWWRICNKGVCIWDDENTRIVVSPFIWFIVHKCKQQNWWRC